MNLAILDQNLELLLDYEQCIEVLKYLKFINKNVTILLKGCVASKVPKSFLHVHIVEQGAEESVYRSTLHKLILTKLIPENTLGAYDLE